MTSSLPDKPVAALRNGLAVLRYLSRTAGPVGVTRVAKDLSLNPSTCFNLLKTLVHEGLVSFDDEAKTYTIGLGVVELAKRVLDRNAYIKMIRPDLQDIANQFLVTATLWHRAHNERVILVDLVESDAAVRVHMSIGQRLPMYIAALGRCMAAASSLNTDALREKFLALRWENSPTFEAYAQGVNDARMNGFAVDQDNYVKGVTTVSSVIVDDANRPVMAISAVGFSAQLTKPRVNALGAFIKSRTSQISSNLGASYRLNECP